QGQAGVLRPLAADLLELPSRALEGRGRIGVPIERAEAGHDVEQDPGAVDPVAEAAGLPADQSLADLQHPQLRAEGLLPVAGDPLSGCDVPQTPGELVLVGLVVGVAAGAGSPRGVRLRQGTR